MKGFFGFLFLLCLSGIVGAGMTVFTETDWMSFAAFSTIPVWIIAAVMVYREASPDKASREGDA